MKELNWINLGYANGWGKDSKEQRICDLINRLGYKIESRAISYCKTEYTCEEAKVRWRIVSD